MITSTLFTVFLWTVVVSIVIAVIWGTVKAMEGNKPAVRQYIPPKVDVPPLEVGPNPALKELYSSAAAIDVLALSTTPAPANVSCRCDKDSCGCNQVPIASLPETVAQVKKKVPKRRATPKQNDQVKRGKAKPRQRSRPRQH